MSLYTRLMHLDEPGIGVHGFMAALAEWERGKMTRQQVIDAFTLSAAEQAELDTLTTKIVGYPEAYPMGALVTLTNVGAVYDSTAGSKGLGFTALPVDGVTYVELRIRYNKIGTGTLRWQLWNETDSQQIGFVDDAAAGDNKTASIIVTPASALSGGVKLVRVRVQSTVATDDPVYYGSCLFVRRYARLTADDLHHVLILAQTGETPPYTTEAAVKARLGV